MSGRNKAAFFPLFFLFSPPGCAGLQALCAAGRGGDWEQLPQVPSGSGFGMGLFLEHLGVLARPRTPRPSLTQGQIKWVHSLGRHSLTGNSSGLGSLCGMWDASSRLLTCPQPFARRRVSVTAREAVTAALLASATPLLPSWLRQEHQQVFPVPSEPPGAASGGRHPGTGKSSGCIPASPGLAFALFPGA